MTHADLRHELGVLLGDVLVALFGEGAVTGLVTAAGGCAPAPDVAALLAVLDETTGEATGVRVRLSRALARQVAARMFACADPGPEDLLDAVGELGNIAAGSVKAVLFPAGNTTRLSLPSAALGPAGGAPPAGAGAPVTVGALVLGEPVDLTLVHDLPTGGLEWPPITRTDVLEGQP